MKSKWLIASVLILVLLGICAASIFAAWQGMLLAQKSGVRFDLSSNRVPAKTTEQKNITVNGPASLSVTNDFGNISVQSGGDGQISVTAEKTAWGANDADAQAALKELKIIYDQTGNNLTISLQKPVEVGIFRPEQEADTVKFTIIVPAQTVVTLNSTFGDLSLAGTTGSADLLTDFGSINLANVSGEIKGRSNNGSITAKKLSGQEKITLSSQFGKITVDTLQGSDVSISSSNGALDLTGVQASGFLKVDSEFGTVHISDASAAAADIRSNNGGVRLEKLNLDGKITVTSEFGDLTLTQVVATAYDLRSNNGKINVDGASGPITAHSEFGKVEVLNAENATLDLSSNNGGVTFSGSLGDGPHNVKSEFGAITLNFPAELKLNVDLQTELGKISSDFDIAISGKPDEKHWTGKINGGGDDLTVKDNNGNIKLQILK